MKKLVWLASHRRLSSGSVLWYPGGDRMLTIGHQIQGGQKPAIAIPDFRGSGDAQNFMGVFNRDLVADVESAGLKMVVQDRSLPTFVPQQPSDFQQPAASAPSTARPQAQAAAARRPPPATAAGCATGPGPPVQANYLAFGYTGAQNGVLVLRRAWLFDLSGIPPSKAQVIGKRYLGIGGRSRRAQGGPRIRLPTSLPSSAASPCSARIFIFSSNRTGHKEIWVMDPDGRNQRQITRFNNISTYPTSLPTDRR
jgi:TolB protein